MLFHHLFAFPEWYVEGVSYIGIPLRANTLEYVIGQFGHICVAVFAFLTGYGMFFSYKSGSIIKKSFKKGISFLFCYWLILFLVAIPVNLVLGKTDLTYKFVLKNMFAYNNTLVSFAWYVRFYIEMLVTLPLFYWLLKKLPKLSVPVFLIMPVVAYRYLGTISSTEWIVCKSVYYLMEYFLWIPCVLTGLIFAHFNLFEKLGKLFKRMGKAEFLTVICMMLVLVYIRAYKTETSGISFNRDCILAPIFVFLAVTIIDRLPQIFRGFLKLMGKHSMNIWFLHSLFFFRTAELMKYIYIPKVSVLIVAWVIVICMPFSWIFTKVTDFVFSRKPKKAFNEETEKESKVSLKIEM